MLRKSFVTLLLILLGALLALPVLAQDSSPIARNDSLDALVAVETAYPAGQLFDDNGSGPDDLGTPEAKIQSFGGGSMGGSVVDNAAGTTADLAGGKLTVNADGSLILENPTQNGLFTFIYRLRNAVGFDDASVTFEISEVPDAKRDDYVFLVIDAQYKSTAAGLFADNGYGPDNLGRPEAKLTSFGGGSMGGSVVDYAAGETVPLAGGLLTVNGDGSWSLTDAPFTAGDYNFRYRIANSAGNDYANVFLVIQAQPLAYDDELGASLDEMNSLPAGTLFADNGSSEDDLGFPEAQIVTFGGGSLGGDVTSNNAGETVALAGGTLTVNSDGSLLVNGATIGGTYTFKYRLQNDAGSSEATVTLELTRKPVALPDTYTFFNTADQSLDTTGGLFADNGNGTDKRGDPEAEVVSFGGGSLSGGVTTNASGTSVILAGGRLTVNSDGSWSLQGQPFDHGVYTFRYRLENSGGWYDATVTLNIEAKPLANDDSLLVNVSTPFAGDLYAYNGNGVDDLGTPAATLTSFGGGSLGGDVTSNAAGSSVPLNGGTLTVDADGIITLTDSIAVGGYVFDYRLTNSQGTSDAQVTIIVSDFTGAAPEAENDDLSIYLDRTTDLPAGTLFGDNGHGKDFLGFPLAEVVSFGGGDLGGSVAGRAPGTTADFAGGMLTVNTDGSLTIDTPDEEGIFTFEYRLGNKWGMSDATVTVEISQLQQTVEVFLPAMFQDQ
jgi:hypothetical protein